MSTGFCNCDDPVPKITNVRGGILFICGCGKVHSLVCDQCNKYLSLDQTITVIESVGVVKAARQIANQGDVYG